VLGLCMAEKNPKNGVGIRDRTIVLYNRRITVLVTCNLGRT
jgi:hypothetical protein